MANNCWSKTGACWWFANDSGWAWIEAFAHPPWLPCKNPLKQAKTQLIASFSLF
jgi:hypothetical protein